MVASFLSPFILFIILYVIFIINLLNPLPSLYRLPLQSAKCNNTPGALFEDLQQKIYQKKSIKINKLNNISGG